MSPDCMFPTGLNYLFGPFHGAAAAPLGLGGDSAPWIVLSVLDPSPHCIAGYTKFSASLSDCWGFLPLFDLASLLGFF